jgi:hypothetical protein
MRAVLAVVAGAAIAITAGAVHHVRAVNVAPRCSAATTTQRSDQDPGDVMAYWTKGRIEQAHRNMRNASGSAPPANGSCADGP